MFFFLEREIERAKKKEINDGVLVVFEKVLVVGREISAKNLRKVQDPAKSISIRTRQQRSFSLFT